MAILSDKGAHQRTIRLTGSYKKEDNPMTGKSILNIQPLRRIRQKPCPGTPPTLQVLAGKHPKLVLAGYSDATVSGSGGCGNRELLKAVEEARQRMLTGEGTGGSPALRHYFCPIRTGGRYRSLGNHAAARPTEKAGGPLVAGGGAGDAAFILTARWNRWCGRTSPPGEHGRPAGEGDCTLPAAQNMVTHRVRTKGS